MLSLSAEISQADVDLGVINGEGDGGVLFGLELRQFAEALASRDEDALSKSRTALRKAAGNDVLVDAAAVAANFQRMVRIADSTGLPVDEMVSAISGAIPQELNLRRFASARHTPRRTLLQKLRGIPVRLLARRLLKSMQN